MDNQNTSSQSGANKGIAVIAIGIVVGLALGFLGGFLIGSGSGGGSSSVVSFINKLEDKIASSVPGGKGPVVATVENTEIYKSVFARKFDVYIDSTRLSPSAKVKVKSSSEYLGKFLTTLVDSVVLLKAIEKDQKILDDPDFLIQLNLGIVQLVQNYYFTKKLKGKIDQTVSEKDYSDAYRQLQKNPRYSKMLVRMKMAQVKKVIKSQILRRRLMLGMKKYSDKLKQQYRIKTFDSRLLGTGGTSR